MRKILSAIAVVAPIDLATTDAAARCALPTFPIYPGSETSVTMETGSGESCGIFVQTSRGTMATRVLEAPRRGVVRRFGQNLFYRSAPGFVGTDGFVYQRDVEDRGGVLRQATVRVIVNVR